jgi:hypothetical protein
VWCTGTGTPQRKRPADWDAYGNNAGFHRNTQMVEEEGIQLLLAFPGANGTRDMINKCLAANIPVKMIEAHPNDRTYAEQESAAEAAA